MKKLILSALVAVAAINANAQFYLGGSLGFSSEKNSYELTEDNVKFSEDNTSTSFSIAPEIGYKLNDKMAVGLAIGFETSKEPDGENYSTKSNAFIFQPYFRYTFVKWNKVSLFTDVELGLAFGKTTEEYTEDNVKLSADEKYNQFHFAIVPGVAYQASDAISVVAKLGTGLGYWNTSYKPNDYEKSSISEFGLNVNTLGLTIGVYYNF